MYIIYDRTNPNLRLPIRFYVSFVFRVRLSFAHSEDHFYFKRVEFVSSITPQNEPVSRLLKYIGL